MFPKDLNLEKLNQTNKGTMMEHLGIEFTALGDDFLEATMPVDHRTIQPLGLLHGGANVTLAETLGSIAAHLTLDTNKQYAVGLEINANHIRSVKSGVVTGKTTPIHIGRSTHIWSIDIRNEESKLVATSRITMAILDKR